MALARGVISPTRDAGEFIRKALDAGNNKRIRNSEHVIMIASFIVESVWLVFERAGWYVV